MEVRKYDDNCKDDPPEMTALLFFLHCYPFCWTWQRWAREGARQGRPKQARAAVQRACIQGFMACVWVCECMYAGWLGGERGEGGWRVVEIACGGAVQEGGGRSWSMTTDSGSCPRGLHWRLIFLP